MMKGGLGGMMKQAQQLQQNMQKAQAELAGIEVQGQAGSGKVTVTMTCAHVVSRVSLDDSLLADDRGPRWPAARAPARCARASRRPRGRSC